MVEAPLFVTSEKLFLLDTVYKVPVMRSRAVPGELYASLKNKKITRTKNTALNKTNHKQ